MPLRFRIGRRDNIHITRRHTKDMDPIQLKELKAMIRDAIVDEFKAPKEYKAMYDLMASMGLENIAEVYIKGVIEDEKRHYNDMLKLQEIIGG